MKRWIILGILVVGFIAAIAWACCLFKHGNIQAADFVVKVALSLGTLSAVVCALFGEWLREWSDPIRIKITKPLTENNNADKRPTDQKYEYCHHLVVQNCTPQKPITDCQIWLKRIFFKPEGDEWKEIPFAVPRLMQWAPSEYSPEKRTFGHQQTFDLGVTVQNNEGFKLTIKQGGMFISVFKVGEKVRLVFVVTANNYSGDDEFPVEVDIHKTQKTGTITPAEVFVPVGEPQWLKEANERTVPRKVPYVTPSREPIKCEIVWNGVRGGLPKRLGTPPDKDTEQK
jgi:hypothetical protein